ncbi:hypothetical protein HZH66_007938 [Vespula vulgaris]|uniref:MATH domain-containing protein n=1 Tax=Vespula vulgaris TaxID=7454 RepID=A0A834JU96_VESVU|nr:hypothetical protein HZH66_007938 [Vespula vulgaris]
MALLYRFVQLPDRSGTRVFSFVVTRSVVRDPERDVTSKELVCGFQRWAVAFSRGDKVLGVYLVWRGASRNLRVYVDFTFTLLNREHFSMNEGFSGKRVKFTYELPAQGNRNYIPVSDLYTRNFADTNGEFQLELSMANVRTVYMTEVRMPTGVFSTGQPKSNKLETDCFTFGGFDWSVVIYPYGNKEAEGCRGQENRVSVYLMRLTGFDHRCRVRYSVALGEGDRRIDSGQIEDLSNAEGYADLHSETVRLHLIYKDINHVPRNHLRYVNWSAYLLRGDEPDTVAIGLPGAPFSRYYAQESVDEGIIMETNLDTNEIKDNHCPFLTDKKQLRIRLEWNESHLLFQATYHKYDDVCRIHNQQMRREIASLQAENYSLERQLFSYQKSLAFAQAQQQQHQQQQQQQQQQHQQQQQQQSQTRHTSHQAHLERSTSTDTEYA